MASASIIKYLSNEEIDKARWDNCIINADNGLIYASSFYLDAISPGWHGITNEAYDWVLPITSGKKLGISYLYQPNFTQQLGVFYKKNANIPWQEILDYLKTKFRFWEISWNYATPVDQIPPSITLHSSTNFILNLSKPYQDIAAHYHNMLKKDLKRSKPFSLRCISTSNYDKSITLYREYYGNRIPHVNQLHYDAFKKACAYANSNNKLLCREAINANNEVVAIALLLFDGNRLYNIMNTTLNAGKKLNANHFLIDAIIQEFAGSNIVLDFEGSDLPGIKAFYENFGVVNQPYYMLKYNNLQWHVRLFKK